MLMTHTDCDCFIKQWKSVESAFRGLRSIHLATLEELDVLGTVYIFSE